MEKETKIIDEIKQSIEVKYQLLEECVPDIESSLELIIHSVKEGNKIMFCGNGGSAADAQHLAAELVIRLRSSFSRPAIAGLALTTDTSILTAGGNDIGFENIFSRSVEAYGKHGDILVAISTSGNSENIIRAVKTAREMGIKAIGLLGNDGGKLKELCNRSVIVPSSVTARIQECHILIGHIWCQILEEKIYKN